jgi:hypothetical protein
MHYPSKILELYKNSPKILTHRIAFWLASTLLILKLVATLGQFPVLQNFFFAEITKVDLITFLNHDRQNLGLPTLTENPALDRAALLKAQDMVNNSYFAHESPKGVSPWYWFKAAGYTYHYAGENLAVGFMDSKTVYDAWFNSPEHKANLLNSHYTEIGTAVVSGFQGNLVVVVQEFGSPMASSGVLAISQPKPAEQPKKPSNTNGNLTANVQPVTANEGQTEIVIPMVAGQSTEQYVATTNGKDSTYLKFLNFMVYNNVVLLTYFSLAMLLAMILLLIINTAMNPANMNKNLVYKSLVIMAILVISLVVNQTTIGHIIPHYVII